MSFNQLSFEHLDEDRGSYSDALSVESKGLFSQLPPHKEVIASFERILSDFHVVGNVYKAVVDRNAVSVLDIESLESLAPRYKSLRSLLDSAPVVSFTKRPTSVNLDISTEGIGTTFLDTLRKILVGVVVYALTAVERLLQTLSITKFNNKAAKVKLDALVSMAALFSMAEQLSPASPSLTASINRARNISIQTLASKVTFAQTEVMVNPGKVNYDIERMIEIIVSSFAVFSVGIKQVLAASGDIVDENQLRSGTGKLKSGVDLALRQFQVAYPKSVGVTTLNDIATVYNQRAYGPEQNQHNTRFVPVVYNSVLDADKLRALDIRLDNVDEFYTKFVTQFAKDIRNEVKRMEQTNRIPKNIDDANRSFYTTIDYIKATLDSYSLLSNTLLSTVDTVSSTVSLLAETALEESKAVVKAMDAVQGNFSVEQLSNYKAIKARIVSAVGRSL